MRPRNPSASGARAIASVVSLASLLSLAGAACREERLGAAIASGPSAQSERSGPSAKSGTGAQSGTNGLDPTSGASAAPPNASAPIPVASPPDAGPVATGNVDLRAAAEGLDAVRRLQRAADPATRKKEYLALRRAVSAGAAIWQARAAAGATALLGPRRPTGDDAGGSLALLDGAMTANDAAAIASHAAQVEKALLLLDTEVRRAPTSRRALATALSAAAYDLGALALESTPGAPDGADAVLADLQGMLDGVEAGAAALARTAEPPGKPGKTETDDALARALRITANLRARFDAASGHAAPSGPQALTPNGSQASVPNAPQAPGAEAPRPAPHGRGLSDQGAIAPASGHPDAPRAPAANARQARGAPTPGAPQSARRGLSDRGAIAVASGHLGVALRKLAVKAGVAVKPPYAAAHAPGDDEHPVSALTLPAPRLPGGRKDPETIARLAELGRKLFLDPTLSRDRSRSCATCHQPEAAFADALVAPDPLPPETTKLRHTPSLLYMSLNAAQMWDGRILTPEAQALTVIHAPAEMGLAKGTLVSVLRAVDDYRRAFEALPGGLTEENVALAIATYEATRLSPGDAPIDRFARGDAAALSPDERAGLDVFAGPGRCARCHVPPSFAGSRPTDFAVPVFAALGLTTGPDERELDPDRGRAGTTGRPLDERAFKTPTVRNLIRTPPYFHNGRFLSLESVFDFYNRGGGRGHGLDVPNQDPDIRPLRLSPEQKRVLLVFLRTALLDATDPHELIAPIPTFAPPPSGG